MFSFSSKLNTEHRTLNTFFIIGALSVWLAGCNVEEQDAYSRSVNAARYSKDSLFKMTEESPFPAPERVKFLELDYFAPDKSYLTEAKVSPHSPKDTVLMANSKGQGSNFLKYAALDFKLKGKDYRLNAYQGIENDPGDGKIHLFIPFYDPTNEKETYHGGRYIETVYDGSGKLALDFNFAFSPYCAYSDNYSCPIPPKENTLPVRVEAGEKMYNAFFK